MTINDPNFQWRPLADLHPSSTNPRTTFDEKAMAELRQSMQQHGFIGAWPIFCRPSKEQEGKLEIIAGERRFRTATDLSLDQVAVVVDQVDDKTVLEMQLVENLQREGLTAIEEGRGYKRLLELRDADDKPMHDVASIAARVGKSVDTIRHKLKILATPESLLAALNQPEKGISERHCLLVARIPDAKMREDAAKRLLEGVKEWVNGQNATRPITVVELKGIIAHDYMVTLKGAPWKLDDADLLPDAGPCKGCQFMAAEFLKDTEELAKVKTGKGGSAGVDPLTCCNPGCHAQKMKRHFEIQSQAVVAGGGRILPASEVKKVFYPHGGLSHDSPYVPLEAKPGYNVTGVWDDSKTPTYEKLMADAAVKPKITIAQSPKGEVVQFIDRKAAEELARKLKKDGKLKKTPPTEKEKKERDERLLQDRASARTRVLALSMLAEHITVRGVGIEQMIGHIELSLWHAGIDGCRLVAEWMQVEVAKKKGQHLQSLDYSKAIIAHIIERGDTLPSLQAIDAVIRVAKEVKQWGWPPECYKILAKAHGFDPKLAAAAALKAVKAEADEKAAKKAAKNGPPEKKPPMKSKSASAARNAGVNAADEGRRDKISGGRLSGGPLDHCFMDMQVDAFAKRMLETNVPPSEPNEHGVFVESYLFKLRVGRAVVGVRLAQTEDGQWVTGYEYDNPAAKQSKGGGGFPNVKGKLSDRFKALDSELLSLVEHLNGDDYGTMIERLKDARASLDKLAISAPAKAPAKIISIQEFAKEVGLVPAEERAGPEDQSTRAKALEIYKETKSLKKAAEGSGAKLDAVRNWKRRDPAWS